MIYTIKVTAEDIANGKKSSACRCPVALAAKRCVPWAAAVYVLTSKGGSVDVGDSRWVFDEVSLPKGVADKAARFDRIGGTMEPFTFKLELSR